MPNNEDRQIVAVHLSPDGTELAVTFQDGRQSIESYSGSRSFGAAGKPSLDEWRPLLDEQRYDTPESAEAKFKQAAMIMNAARSGLSGGAR